MLRAILNMRSVPKDFREAMRIFKGSDFRCLLNTRKDNANLVEVHR